MKPELLVMAAGVASRYGSLKQIEPVGPAGETLMDYSVYDALRAGVERLVFVIRRETERDFHEAVGRRYAQRAEVAYAFQSVHDLPAGYALPAGRTKPWGTGHAVLAAESQIHAPFLVANADDFYGAEAFGLLAGFLAQLADAPPERYAMVTYPLCNTLSDQGAVSRGLCVVSPEGFLTEVTEHTAIARTSGGAAAGEHRFTGAEPVSMNLWAFRPSLFPLLEERFEAFLRGRLEEPGAELYLPAVVADLISSGEATVRAFPTSCPWFGVTYKADRPVVVERLRALVERGDYPSPLWA
jgi:NDP-sugar pyrophosphorylase family protein